MTDAGNVDGRERNEDMVALHERLVALVASLDLAIDDAPDAATVRRLTAEIAAANARVTAVGRQLFAAGTRELSDAARDVQAAIPRVEAAIGDVARLDSMLTGLSGVLGLVDRAVGLAKAVG